MKMQHIPGFLDAAKQADDSVLLVGLHGIGKTEIAKQWAKKNNIHLEILYLSNQEVGDIIGIPVTKTINTSDLEDSKAVTEWAEPIWLHRMKVAAENGQGTACMLDEFSRATLDVRQACLQLVLDKKIHQHNLPDGTFIIAADNPDNGNYAVETLDPALLDRFNVVNVEADVTGWLDYARNKNLNKVVRAFIADNPSKLNFQPEEGSDETIGATSRSWAKLASYIDNFNNVPKELHYPIINGKVGNALAAQFLNFYNNYKSMISIKDIEKLTEELRTKNLNLEQIGEGIAELLKDSEVVQKTELTNSLIAKYINSSYQEAIPMLGILYSLDMEIITAVLKNMTTSNLENYYKLVQLDKNNDKKLFLKITKSVKI